MVNNTYIIKTYSEKLICYLLDEFQHGLINIQHVNKESSRSTQHILILWLQDETDREAFTSYCMKEDIVYYTKEGKVK